MRAPLLILFALLTASACGGSEAPDHSTHEPTTGPTCAYCEMALEPSNAGYGARFLAVDDTEYRFGAIECLAAYLETELSEDVEVASLGVANHDEPEAWLDAGAATFLLGDEIESPMGFGLAAFASRDAAERAQERFDGELLDWTATRDRVRERWGLDSVQR